MSALAARLFAVPSVIPHHHSDLGPEEEAAAVRVLRSGRLAPGSGAARLETLLARLTEAADAVSLASGSTALTLALRGLGLGKGDRIGLSSYSGTGLLHAVRSSGATPLIADIDPRTLAIDPDDLERRAGRRRLSAVVVGHPGGRPVPLEPFLRSGLKVIEECGEALGATIDGRPVGSRGDAAILCFSPARPVTCGGPGGAVTSSQVRLIRAIRRLASCEAAEVEPWRVEGLMGDLQAAVATVQIERLPELIARRASIAARYSDAFPHAGMTIPSGEDRRRGVFSRYLIRVGDAGRFIEDLRRRGILAQRPVERPLHRCLGLRSRFPVTDAACAEIVSLPIYPSLKDRMVERIIDEVTSLLG